MRARAIYLTAILLSIGTALLIVISQIRDPNDCGLSANTQDQQDAESVASSTTDLLPRAHDSSLEATMKPMSNSDSASDDSADVRGAFGAPLTDPYYDYHSSIEVARQGNSSAQYKIASVLFECKGLPTQEYLDELIFNGTLTDDMGAETQQRLDVCRELIDSISAKELGAWNDWQSAAAVNGHPLALGRELVFKPGRYTFDQAREIAAAIVRVDSPEKYMLLAAFFANYRSDDEISYQAWMRLACQSMAPCNIDEFLGEGSEPLLPSESDQVEALLEEIKDAMSRGEWSEIQF